MDYIIAQHAERRQPTDKQKYHRDRRLGHKRYEPEDSHSDSSDIEIVEILTNELEESTNARLDQRQRDRKANSSRSVPSKRPRRTAPEDVGAKGEVIVPPVSHPDARMDKGKERAPSPDEDSQHECVPSSGASRHEP